MERIIFDAVMFVVVPITLAMLVLAAFVLCAGGNEDQKLSAKAGLVAGFVGFVIYAIAFAVPHSNLVKFNSSHPPAFHLTAFIVGTIMGFLMPLIIDAVSGMKVLGVLTLILTFGGLAGLYGYFFDATWQRIVLYSSLSVIFGWALSGIFPPTRREWGKIFP